MNTSVNERINAVLKRFKKTPNGLATMLDMIPSTVNRQLKGEQALSAKVIEGVLSVFPEVSAEWLLRGSGDMLINEDKSLAKMQDDKIVEVKHNVADESKWKTKYETLKECYDSLLASLGGIVSKRNVG